MKEARSRLTERGQISMPATIRRALGIKPGQRVLWQKVSDRECRVLVEPASKPLGVQAMRGFLKRYRRDGNWPMRAEAWMKLLREGEKN